MKPDRDDGAMLVLLAQWSTLMGLRLEDLQALRVGRAGTIPVPRAGIEPEQALAVCEYFDAIGVLHSHGLVNEDLLFDWMRVSHIWDGVKEYVVAQRQTRAAPQLWAHFEALAVAHKRLTREYST
jgi:hypothetical protein